MILARNSITLHHLRDITTVVWYYKLQASTASPPAKPTTETPSGWNTTEPSYTEGSTNSLYVTQKTTFSDGTFEYSDVSLSSAYEAAKTAYNKSVQAKSAADAAQESIDNLEIGGRNLVRDTADWKNCPYAGDTATVSGEEFIAATTTGTNWRRINGWFTKTKEDIYSSPIVISFDVKKSDNTPVSELVFQLFTTSKAYKEQTSGNLPEGSRYYINLANSIWKNTENVNKDTWTRVYSIPIIMQECFNTTSYTEYDYLAFYVGVKAATGSASFRHLKIELGSKATDWTPAPEDLQAGIDTLQPELIVGTHGTTATATWTGTSIVLTEIKAGTRIQYKMSSAGASNVTLNLTLKNGTTTGAKNVYFLNTTRLGTQYGVNAIVDLIYDGSAWRVLNPYTNSNTVGTYGGAVKAGANGVKNYSLVMRDTETTWVSLTTTAGTGTTKSRYTGKLYPDNVMYMGSNSAYASGATTGTCYEALGVNLQYSTNCGSTLTSGRAVYLVGTLDSDGLFTLDATWWTQTIPTTADGKTYIYLGLAYSTTNIYLVPENTLYQYFEGAFRTLREIEEMKAAKVADNYLSSDNTGIMVADMTDGTQYTPGTVPSGTKNTFINEDSFQVRDGQETLASFGTTIVIGKRGTNNLRAKIESGNFQIIDNSDNVLVNIGRVPAAAGEAKKVHYEFGPRQSGTPYGNYSFVQGTDNAAVFDNQVVIGQYGRYGYRFNYSASVSSDTPTFTINVSIYVAMGFTENDINIEIPDYDYTWVLNDGIITVTIIKEGIWVSKPLVYVRIGKDIAFAVGNGTENSRSDAFEVTWDGNARMALDETATTGIDAELYAAITAHGWESEVLA